MSSRSKGQLVIILIIVAIAAIILLSRQAQDTIEEPLTEVAAQIRAGNVDTIQVKGD